jgi:hypothetical protein
MSSRSSLPATTLRTASNRSSSLYGTLKRIIFMDSRRRVKWSARRKPYISPSRSFQYARSPSKTLVA